MKITSLIFIIFLFCLCCYGQEKNENNLHVNDTIRQKNKINLYNRNGDYQNIVQLPSTPSSPEVAGILRNDKTQMDFFNGIPDITIPIYDIKLKKYNLPINLKYNIRGNKPDEHPTSVGLGWSLYAGGHVTRIVNGIRDTKYVLSTENKQDLITRTLDDYITECENKLLSKYIYRRFTLPHDNFHSIYNYLRAPDLDEFIVNVGKLQASFYMYKDANGKLITKISSKNSLDFKVEIIEKAIPSYSFIGSDTDYEGNYFDKYLKVPIQFGWDGGYEDIYKIKITDSDGMIYIFGNDPDAFEIKFEHCPTKVFNTLGQTIRNCDGKALDKRYDYKPSEYSSSFQGEIVTWHLTEIITPYHETIYFRYTKKNINIIETIAYNPPGAYNNPQTCHYHKMALSYIYPSTLNYIIASNGDKLQFIHSKRQDILNYQSIDLSAPKTEQRIKKMIPYRDNITMQSHKILEKNFFLKLNKIYIYNYDNLRSSISLNYINNPKERLKLSDLVIKDSEYKEIMKYGFKYNPQLLPNYSSMQTDNWGYYNGKDFSNFQYTDLSHLYEYRGSDPEKMKAEILESITYPTGGKWSFEYEANTYSKIATKYPCGLKDESGIAGGLRIKSIKMSSSEEELPVIKKYYYLNTDGKSSGILSHQPLYKVHFENINPYDAYDEYSEGNFESLTYLHGSHLTYSRVVEELNDGSYTVYNYTNFDTFNDIDPTDRCRNSSEFNDPSFAKYIDEKYTDQSINRGLLKQKEYYSPQKAILKKEEYTYNTKTDEFLKVVNRKPYSNYYYNINSNKIFIHFPSLEKEITTEYTPTGNIQKTIEYTYNRNRLISKIKMKNSDNTSDFIKTFRYIDESNTSIPVYRFIKRSNLLSSVTREQTIYNHKEYNIYTSYKIENEICLPEDIYYGTGKEDNEYECKLTYNRYDNYGNPVYITKNDAKNTVYLWSYDGQYLIAEIQNVTIEEVETVIKDVFGINTHLNAINYLASQTNPNETNIMSFNRHPGLSSALVTTYTYKPLIGISSMTDPKGVTTYFEYDSYGRLKESYYYENNDINKKRIIQSHEYHYQNQ